MHKGIDSYLVSNFINNMPFIAKVLKICRQEKQQKKNIFKDLKHNFHLLAATAFSKAQIVIPEKPG